MRLLLGAMLLLLCGCHVIVVRYPMCGYAPPPPPCISSDGSDEGYHVICKEKKP